MLRILPFARGLLVVALGSIVGCGSVESVACGSYTTFRDGECIGNPPALDAGPPGEAGLCSRPPTFGGVVDVSPASPTSLQVTWAPAVDPFTPSDHFRYRVYLASKAGGEDYTSPVVETAPGATHVHLDDLQPPGTTWYVVVRAVDECGQADGNVVEKSALAVDDVAAPLFGGITGAEPATDRGGAVKVSWDAAADEFTKPAGIVYLVYSSNDPATVFTSTPVISEPGATSMVVGGFPDKSVNLYFGVRARDAAGNVDRNKLTKGSRASADVQAPVFGGCTDASQKDATSIVLAWRPPKDDVATVDQLTVEAYVGVALGKEDFTRPFASFRAGAPNGLVTGLKPGTTYYIVCRALDPARNSDANTFELSASTGRDDTPPAFGGLATITSVDPTKVTLGWAAAVDDQTPEAELVYTAYLGDGAALDYGKPVGRSSPGATTLDVGGLVADHDYFFAVRATDLAGNEEHNTLAKTFHTSPGFGSIQAIFSAHCATAGCHVIGGSAPFPLIAGASYHQIVGVPSVAVPSLLRVTPGDASKSYLYLELTGGSPATGVHPSATTGLSPSAAEVVRIERWIDLGATSK